MRKAVKVIVLLAAWALLAVPLALVLTLALLPLWRWLEAATGIESIGHSGPSEWCYAAMYGIIMSASIVALGILRLRK